MRIINGYKEHEEMLPIDPTTIKPRTKDTDGFVKYSQGEKYAVSYRETEMDVYEERVVKTEDMEILQKEDQKIS